MPRALMSLVVCGAASVAAFNDANAIGFGRLRGSAVLGQPLDVAVPLRFEPGKALAPDCFGADVSLGGQRMAPSAVRTRLETAAGERQLRIRTLTPIDEPVVDVTVTVGCGARVSRRFVAFADPQGTSPRRTVFAERPAAAPTGVTPRQAAKAVQAPRPEAREPAAPAVAPRLTASAADASGPARVSALEAELARLRAESQAQHDALLRLRTHAAEQSLAAALMPWLLAGVVLLGALTSWLALRMRQLSRDSDRWWASQVSSHVPDASEWASDPRGAFSASTTANAVFDGGARPRATASPPMPDTAPAALQTSPPPPALANDHDRHHGVTAEEQIDLEQQADFFIVLGQDEAAIDVLLSHLRATGGTSPTPYLTLLEIYRRTNDRGAYERTRIRFNQRFNGVAPAWDTDPEAGRTLNDYPQVMQRLQQVWRSTPDAMAELESLLFRKASGVEPFDLPAYREVVFLYQLAREMNQHEKSSEPRASQDIDVLLPMDAESTPGGLLLRDIDVARTVVLHPSAHAPEPLDIDLSQPDVPPAVQRSRY